MPRKNKYIGSSFDDFLEESGILEEVNATAMKRVIAWQIQEAMKAQHLTKTRVGEGDGGMYRCFLAIPYKDGKSRSNLTSFKLMSIRILYDWN